MPLFKNVLGDAKVFYRILPSETINWKDIKILENEKNMQIHHLGPRIVEEPDKKVFREFKTDGIFYNISQDDIYPKIMEDVIESVLGGQNAIIIAFGQTGSGKSLTIGGLHAFYQDRGLIPRAIENIFRLKGELSKNLEMIIDISYIEILSMTQAHDLLKTYPAVLFKHNINKNVKRIRVTKDLEALQHLFIGEARKEYTAENKYPSHIGSSIFTFNITLFNMDFSDPYEFNSKLHIVDLAGTDFFGETFSTQQVETANSAKSYLEHFMLLLIGNDKELIRVKRRTNIISQYFGDTFSRDSLLRFIGHLKTEKYNMPLTISMLKLGQKVKNMQPFGTRIILKENELLKITILQAKLDSLRKEKIISEMLGDNFSKNLCQDRKRENEELVQEFLKHQIKEDDLFRLVDIGTIFKVMKEKINSHEADNVASIYKHDGSDKVERLETPRDSIPSMFSTKSKMSSIIQNIDTHSTISPTVRELNKSSHTKKNGFHTKTHKRDIIDSDNRSITKRGKISTSSFGKHAPTLSKKKLMVDSVSSLEKINKKNNIESHVTTNSLINIESFLPEVIPEHKEALKEFLQFEGSSYNITIESIKEYDEEAKNLYQTYLEELKSLNSLFEILEMRRNEMMQSTLLRQFSRKEQIDAKGNIVRSKEEENCNENVRKAEQDVSKQQEKILGIQAEYRLLLEMRKQAKQNIKDEFDEFCRTKYHTQSPNLEDDKEIFIENELPVHEFYGQLETNKHLEDLSQERICNEIFKNLRNLMTEEAKMKKLFLKKNIKWSDDQHLC